MSDGRDPKSNNDSMEVQYSVPGKAASESRILEQALQNETVIHRILLTDDDKFETEITWNGQSRAPTIGFEEFKENFLGQDGSESLSSLTNEKEFPTMPQHIRNSSIELAMELRMSFSRKMKNDLMNGFITKWDSKEGTSQTESSQKCFLSYQTNIAEMNDMVRSLIPRRTDLHSFLSDDVRVPKRDTASTAIEYIITLLEPLKGIANALLKLESPDRDWSIREWFERAAREIEHLSSITFDENEKIEQPVMFLVNSMTYLHHAIEQTQIDIANASLVQSAPLLKQQGVSYEREKFRERFLMRVSPLDPAPESSNDEGPSNFCRLDLISVLPHTTTWIKNAKDLVAEKSPSFSLKDLKMTGFVKALVFTSVAIALPEVLHLDLEILRDIRRISQRIVLGTALVLQLGVHGPQRDEDIIRKNMLRDELLRLLSGKNHVFQKLDENEWRNTILDVLSAYGSSNKDASNRLTESEEQSLRMRCVTVFEGADPVLKLMDSRIREFFIYACGWEHVDEDGSGKDLSSSTSLPSHLQSGRLGFDKSGSNFSHPPLLDNSMSVVHSKIRQYREAFLADAMVKATALKFELFARDLADIGYKAHKVMQLMCNNHGVLLRQHIQQLKMEKEMNEVD